MKRDTLLFATACCVAFGLFALYHNIGNKHGLAYAFSNAEKSMQSPYSASSRNKISRNIMTSPKEILALSGQDIREVLKQPELIRHDLPTTIWQYRGPSCVLDLYFTTSGENILAESIIHYEIRARHNASKPSPKKCMSSIIKSRRNI